jgi:uncharacterized protein YecE (DUF72 family)
MKSKVLIGTSGWHYEHWWGNFYPESMRAVGMLDFYAQRFETVEINNSFYHLPSAKTFAGWKDQTPKGFTFAVKANRYITHMKKLKDPAASIRKFFQAVEALEPKLGPILFQLPPRWHRDAVRLEGFLRVLPGGHRYAFEFRDPTWFHQETWSLLEKYKAAWCVYDLAEVQSPERLTCDFGYLRLHGPASQKYSGRYTRAQLRRWLEACRQWLEEGARQVYIYFDNDQSGYAAQNAADMRKLAAALEV